MKDKFLTFIHKPWSGFIAFLVLLSLFTWVYLSMIANNTASRPDEISLPVIYADSKPFKRIPEDTGGMHIPYQSNSLINPDNTKSTAIEPQSFKPMRIDLQADDEQTSRIESLFDLATKQKTPEIIKDVVKIKKKPEPVIIAKPEKAAPPPPSGTHYVQLASLKTNVDAESAWKTITAKHKNILANQNKRIQKTTIPNKGTFYRLQVGPLSETNAKNLCESLKKANAGCFLVKK